MQYMIKSGTLYKNDSQTALAKIRSSAVTFLYENRAVH